nr:hypothetical protein [Burkholderia gladioli]
MEEIRKFYEDVLGLPCMARSDL